MRFEENLWITGVMTHFEVAITYLKVTLFLSCHIKSVQHYKGY